MHEDRPTSPRGIDTVSEAGTAALAIYLLGDFRVVVDGEVVPVERWPRRKSKSLLKLLALAPGNRLHRERVTEALWPEAVPSSASNNLNKAILMARRALEPTLGAGAESRFIYRDEDQIGLARDAVWVDVEAFEAAARCARDADGFGHHEAALDLYAGDLLMDDAYEDWAWARRDQLRAAWIDLAVGLAEERRRADDFSIAIDRYNDVLAREPAHERAHRGLMDAYHRAGDRERALRQFEACKEAVERSVGAAPDAETLALRDRIAGGGDVAPSPASTLDPRSIAVFPFRNESADGGLDYLCDGLTESLINGLSQVSGLVVIARSTVFRYRDRAADDGGDPLALGRQLGIGYAVLGRVHQYSERLVVGVELVSIADGAHRWGYRFDRPNADIFAVQDEIAREISTRLSTELSPEEASRLKRRHADNPLAYQNYLKGRFAWNKRTGEGLKHAIKFFQEALEHDPSYALAYAGLADCYNLLSLYSVTAPERAMPMAKASAERALAIDDGLAEAHTSLAYVRFYFDWDFAGAERDFKRAIELNPNYATAQQWYHELLTASRRFDEQREAIRKAERLDPLSSIIKAEVGWGLYFQRRFDDAETHLLQALEMDPLFPVGHLLAGLVRLARGATDRALESIRRAVSLDDRFPLALASLAHACGVAGDDAGAARAFERLDRLSAHHWVSAYCRVVALAGLGRLDDAVSALAAAVDERCDRLVYIDVDPLLDPLRERPEFATVRAAVHAG